MKNNFDNNYNNQQKGLRQRKAAEIGRGKTL